MSLPLDREDIPLHVRTIPHPQAPVQVWFDARPGIRSVMLDIEAYGQEVHLPVEVARAVALAVLDATSPSVEWCDPLRCRGTRGAARSVSTAA